MKKQTVIVSGGMLEESFVLPVLKSRDTDCVIAADRGLEFLYEHRIRPDHIVGDFDSLPPEILAFYREQTDIPIRTYDPVKDYTDTEIALRLALKLGKKDLILLGATGDRVDHVWGNVQTLKIALDAGASAQILDPHNRIRLTDRSMTLKRAEAFGKYFSLFPLGKEIEDLSISGAKYPLSRHCLKPYDSLSVSNQIEGEEVVIEFSEGILVLIETRD